MGLTPARPALGPGGRRPPRRAYGAADVMRRARRAPERGATHTAQHGLADLNAVYLKILQQKCTEQQIGKL
jgi:hypothetical protein